MPQLCRPGANTPARPALPATLVRLAPLAGLPWASFLYLFVFADCLTH